MPDFSQGLFGGGINDLLAYIDARKKVLAQNVGGLLGLGGANQTPTDTANGLLGDLAGRAQGQLDAAKATQSVFPEIRDQAQQQILNGLLNSGGALAAPFRAVSAKELDAIRRTGQIKSNNSLALPIERHFGLTPFADTPEDAAMYANLNKASGKSYILDVAQTPDMKRNYTELPSILQERNRLLAESNQLRTTLAGNPNNPKMFSDWLASNEADVKRLNDVIAQSRIPEDVIANAPDGVRLPYLQTPNSVPASNIRKILPVP